MNRLYERNISKNDSNNINQYGIETIAKQMFLWYIVEERKIGKKLINKIGYKKTKQERDGIINERLPYLKDKQSFQNHLITKYRKEGSSAYNQYCKYISLTLSETLDFNVFLDTINKTNINISKQEKTTLKLYFIKELANFFSCSPLSLNTMKMTLISSYKLLADIIIKDMQLEEDKKVVQIKNIIGKRIEDTYIDFTIPFVCREKNKQMVENLGSEKIITFCCPDYRYYRDSERNLRCDTSFVGDDIGNFGEILLRTVKKVIPDIYSLGKLKTLTIIMPTYQIYLSPNETGDYDRYCQKLLSTANKIKIELDNYFNNLDISIQIECKLSNQIYTDQEIYSLKEKISLLVEPYISNEFNDFYNKIIGVETTYRMANNEDKTKDILVSDISEGYLLKKYMGENTLYLLPEDEKMLRPQLVYMIQNQEMNKNANCSIGGLPTIIIQNTSFALD